MATKLVLFTSGNWSDYGLSGLMEVDEDSYHKAIKGYDDLEKQIGAAKKDLAALQMAGDITRNQITAREKEIEGLQEEQFNVWNSLKTSGTPVEVAEFWCGAYC